MNKIIILLFSAITLLTTSIYAQERADIIINIDQSKSILNNLPAIKMYIKDSIFKKVVRPDDMVYIYSFDEKFHRRAVLKGNVSSQKIDEALNEIKAVGEFTDLVNSVVSMTDLIGSVDKTNKKKIIFFLTDGINDPPPNSPYTEGINHEFFKKSKQIIKKEGWSTFIVGIGGSTDAGKIAKELNAEKIELNETVSVEIMDKGLTKKLQFAREEIEQTGSSKKIENKTRFTLGAFYRYGWCLGLKRPEFDTGVQWNSPTTLKSVIDYLQVHEAIIHVGYQLGNNFSLIGRAKYMYIQNSKTIEQSTRFVNDDYNLHYQYVNNDGFHDSSFNGFGIQAGILYEMFPKKNSPYFSISAGYSFYKLQGDYISTHKDIITDGSLTNYYNYTLSSTEFSHMFSLELEFGWIFYVSNIIGITIGLGVEIPIMASLYSNVEIKNTYALNMATLNYQFYDYIDRRKNTFEGNFPPVIYIQLGVLFRL